MNRFWRNTKTEKHHPEPTPEPLRTVEPPEPAAPAAPRVPGTGYLECDFCHCRLTKTGEVYQMSEQARGYRDDREKHGKQIVKLDEEIAALKANLASKDAEIAALKGSAPAARTGASFL